MSIHIPSSRVGPPTLPGGSRGVEGTPDRIRRPASPSTERTERVAKPQLANRSSRASSAEVPDGIDPALWTILTSEERSFFAQTGSMGPLTYGPGISRGSLPSMRLGGRIDFKV